MEIKAIETVYKGYRFRSRLEARWAVFLDGLGISWEYESEGFDLDGVWYLPDFWLPTFSGGMYCEVKPVGGDFSKARLLTLKTGRMTWLCEGVPDFKIYHIYERWMHCRKLKDGKCSDNNQACESWGWVDSPEPCTRTEPDFGIHEEEGVPLWGEASDENRMFWSPGCSNRDVEEDILSSDYMRFYVDAVYAARSARFER